MLAVVLIAIWFGLPQKQVFQLRLPYPAGVLPNSRFTPGESNPEITESVVISRSFRTSDYRDVPVEEKEEVAQVYRVPWEDRHDYEFDHLIPLDCGGSNSFRNIWPEPLHLNVDGYDLGAKTKDELEAELGRLVHGGRMSLEAAQAEFQDWPKAYEEYVGEFPAYKG